MLELSCGVLCVCSGSLTIVYIISQTSVCSRRFQSFISVCITFCHFSSTLIYLRLFMFLYCYLVHICLCCVCLYSIVLSTSHDLFPHCPRSLGKSIELDPCVEMFCVNTFIIIELISSYITNIFMHD